MRVLEVGLIIGSVPVVYLKQPDYNPSNIDINLKSALIDSILKMAEVALDTIEHLEGSKFILIIEGDKIENINNFQNNLIAYASIGKTKKFENEINKYINPH